MPSDEISKLYESITNLKIDVATIKTQIKIYAGVFTLIAGIILPSIWGLILLSIVNKDVLSQLISYVPFF